MCRMKTVIAIIMLCMIPLSMVHAQREPGSYSIGASGSLGMMKGPEMFDDWAKMGKGFGSEFRFIITEMTSLRLGYTTLSFPIDTDEIQMIFEQIYDQVIIGEMEEMTTVEIDPFNFKASIKKQINFNEFE